MHNLSLILLVFAFVFAVIAAVIMEGQGRWHFGWASLAFYLLSVILGGIGKVLG